MSESQRTETTQTSGQSVWALAAESTLTAAWYATPDYVVSRKRRTAIKTVALVGAVRQGLMVVAAGVVVGAGTIYFEKMIRRAADGLRDRGVSRPNTVIGIAMGALTPLVQRGIQEATEAFERRLKG